MNGSTRALSGAELDHLSDAALVEGVGATTVYARVSAEHKLRVVKAWKARGAVVAMTGDGVNDAPALKEADIGVAMGLTGTDVTKEAADMVVTDDNFASIAAAVEEGRGIYNNIRKAVYYLLSCNLSEIILMLMATVLFLPLPLLPVQILWINLISDGLPALALAVDPNEPDLMRRPPRSPTESFLTARRVTFLSVQGMFIALTTLFAFVVCLSDTNAGVAQARTVAFTVLVVAQLFHALNCRSDSYSVFRLGLFTNPQLLWALSGSVLLQAGIILIPWAREIFQLTPLSAPQWFLAFGIGTLPLIAMEAWKAVRRRTATPSGKDR
jgi:Ca2+-transporting ATPase